MELINATRMTVGYNVGLEPSGRELLVVVVKGSFVLPRPGEPVRLHDAQAPLVTADSFTGEPGMSAPRHEVDFAPRKRACDVLLAGSAHALEGREATRLRASLCVGAMRKEFDVVGDRVWQAGLVGVDISQPLPFARMPISYDRAFGGAVRPDEAGGERAVYAPNPVGRGWHGHSKAALIDGKPLPNTEVVGQVVQTPDGHYRPMALGPLGRGWEQRARYAGSYEPPWRDEVFPFLPADFDERYYQAAPEDQQIDCPQGPLAVALDGFTPDGTRSFVLPYFEAPVTVFPRHGGREAHVGVLDTLCFEPDEERFTMTWRVTRPLKKSIFEVAQVRVGLAGHAPGNA